MRRSLDLEGQVADLQRRVSAMMQPGPVAAVDRAGHRVRLRIGGDDDRPLLSPWIPYGQIAGALKVHTPPTIGQQMHIFSPSGDPRLGVAMPLGWSNAEPAPDTGDHPVVTFGPSRVELDAEGLKITIGGLAVTLTAEAFRVTLGGSEFTVTTDQILAKAQEVVTDGKTKLNNGTRAVVFKGSVDTGGDTNNQGENEVLV